jgi:beta-lysine 5,6-aminomutase beta subunit
MSVKFDPTNVGPYGDTLNDGRMQLSFAMPVPPDERGKEAARQLLKKMGMEEIEICGIRNLEEGFTHFIAYATTNMRVNLEKIEVKVVETPQMDMDEIDDYIDQLIGRPLTVIGACIESDAHTVGIMPS